MTCVREKGTVYKEKEQDETWLEAKSQSNECMREGAGHNASMSTVLAGALEGYKEEDVPAFLLESEGQPLDGSFNYRPLSDQVIDPVA